MAADVAVVIVTHFSGDHLGAALASVYRRLFPNAATLEGDAATRGAVLQGIASADWLHVDAHARFDPAFPELSSIELADGPLLAEDLRPAGGALRFANLSACGSGRWPVTADSGRFGLGGALARLGVPWVVATRAPLRDDVAAAFGRAFYESLAEGSDVPAAYRAGLRAVADRPPTEWAALLLLHATHQEPGQSRVPLTPLPKAEVCRDRAPGRGDPLGAVAPRAWRRREPAPRRRSPGGVA